MKEFLADKRAAKPLQEKFRRERINKSLEELRRLMLGALYENVTMGRVEVLQMAVKYLRQQRRVRRAGSTCGIRTMAQCQNTATDFTPPQLKILNLGRLAPEEISQNIKCEKRADSPSRKACVGRSSIGHSMWTGRSANHTKPCTGRPLQEIDQPRAEISPLIWQPWR